MEQGIISAFKIPTSEKEVSCTLLTKNGSIAAKIKHEPELLKGIGQEYEQSAGKKGYKDAMGSIVKGPEIKARAKAVVKSSRESYGKPAVKMAGDLGKAAALIMKSFISGSPIIVRFHGDGDGVAGAISLYRAFGKLVEQGLSAERQVSWQLNKDVIYSKEAFYSDKLLFSSYKSVERPLLIIIDFGTHIDSNDSIAMTEKLCEVLWIDHHTLPDGFNPGKKALYINPFNYGSDSRMTAGLTASLIAQIMGADCIDMMEAALISDHSACANYANIEAKKAALVLDYMISRRDADSSSLRKIDALVGNRANLEEAYAKVGGMMDDAIATGGKVMKKYKTAEGVNVYVIDFRKVRSGDYPMPGRFSSEMQYRIEQTTGKVAVTVVYYGNYISVRVSKSISKSIGLIGIIEGMKEETSGMVSGGGHMEAASIKAGNYDTSNVVNMLLDRLKAMR